MTDPVRDGRPLLVSVDVIDSRVRVTLEVRSRRHVGEADVAEGGQASALVASAAAATLAALEDATPEAVALRLEWSDIVHLQASLPPLAVVLTTVTVADVPLRAPGAALLRDRPAWAGARAVLQGLNRRLEILGMGL